MADVEMSPGIAVKSLLHNLEASLMKDSKGKLEGLSN